ncbi:MAG: type II toxin-antitoxin system RelE/ParE family toxin [Opitutaceae bacterium]|nr:type II toxin-antitoxin system RelE/ParE family toxin [Opitutaceae bacterium]
MKSRVFHPEADEEYAEAARHYAKISPELGNRFYEEIERVLDEVCKAPHRFRSIDGEIQRYLADDFPYAVLYLNEPDHVWIVAVMPLKRDPDYWKHRLTN